MQNIGYSTQMLSFRDLKQNTPKIQSDVVSNSSSQKFRIKLQQSGFDVKSFMNQNQAYYDHLAGKCVCYQCDCGRCKCLFKKAKIQQVIPGSSLYKDSFSHNNHQESQEIPCQSKWYSHQENSKHIILSSTVQNDYSAPIQNKDKNNQQLVANIQQGPNIVYKPPQSSYQFNYPKYNFSWVPPSMPNLNQLFQTKGTKQIAQSQYQYNFKQQEQNPQRTKGFTYSDNIKMQGLVQNETTYSKYYTGLQEEKKKSFRKSNKQIIYQRSQKQQSPIKKEFDPFTNTIFKSESGKQYTNNPIPICPVKKNLQVEQC